MSAADLAWLAATGAVAFATAWAGPRLFHEAVLRGLRAPRVPHAPPVESLPLPHGRLQPLRLAGPGGRRLAAWVVWPPGPVEGAAPAALVMHGWGANASMMWPVVDPLVRAGCVVLLLDARCHGDSDDEDFTSMPRFAEDIAAGLRWLEARPGVDGGRLALVGHSVGAAASLLYASSDGTAFGGPAVSAVVSLSAFAHPEEVMRRFLAEHRIPYPIVGAAVLRHVQAVIGTRFEAIAPLHTIRTVRRPVLLVHGRDDATVPFDDARRLQLAAPDARLLAVDGGHDLRAGLAPHTDDIVAFLDAALDTPAPARHAGAA
jgi:dipeptidyl aminopeptidase/acylaminoacyl peptidase